MQTENDVEAQKCVSKDTLYFEHNLFKRTKKGQLDRMQLK